MSNTRLRSHLRASPAIVLFLMLCLPGILASCSSAGVAQPVLEESFLRTVSQLEPIQTEPGHKLQVVASTNMVFDTLRIVGGEYIDLQALIPRGADPHAYEPSPGDLRELVDADLVFINGVDLEAVLQPMLSEISADTAILSLSAGLELQSFSGSGNEGTAPADGTHAHASNDPHVWLDPINVQVWAQNAADALGAADPEHAVRYRQNAEGYIHTLASLNEWIHEQVASIPQENRKLVTDHRAMGYFAARYGLELVSTVIPAYSTAAEPSARELAHLVETIQRQNVSAIFVGSNVNTTIAERIAEDTGARIVPLYIGTLSPETGPAGTYLAMMKYNVGAITAGLSRTE